ncbi:hypothetical protein [Halorhabdus amylolytica]|uniref:hypothetical protein n=1 Tax=Halorhabdus amylolytica TaxID=2559573 RepID=UPI0010AB42E3|nr:hypothetical protein [Halorhabdus amylolytica]
MQAPAINSTASGGTEGQYHAMTATPSATGGSGGCRASGTCGGGSCPQGTGQQGQQSAGQQGQQPEPGLDSSLSTSGDLPSSAASLFAPGNLSHQDAILLWTGVNSVLFLALVYMEVNRR